MNKTHQHIERYFEKLTTVITVILGNSITFISALCTVIYWLSSKQFYTQDTHAMIGDVILSITFLSLFIIQKTFNRFAGSLHLKINELVVSHEPARNAVINVETKTEHEITQLSKEYAELAVQIKEVEVIEAENN